MHNTDPSADRKRSLDVCAGFHLGEVLLRRNRWTRQRLLQYQQTRLEKLVKYAVQHSSFYRTYYRNIDFTKPIELTNLPLLSKQTMMEHFDQIVTDPALRIAEIRTHVSQLAADDYYASKYRCVMSSGTTGLPGVFVYNRREWATILGAGRRAATMMSESGREIPNGPVATIGSHTPARLSHRISLSLSATDSSTPILTLASGMPALVDSLNRLQPRVLRTYPSVLELLAIEQIEGRLSIDPRVISTFGEVITSSTIQRVRELWGIVPFNSFAMTEGLFAAECHFHTGLHFFDDLGILELADENDGQGRQGRRIVVTNLYNYTQPLIRYEVSDIFTLAQETCCCGSHLTLVSEIDGRKEDTICLLGDNGRKVLLHAGLFRSTISKVPGVRQFEVLWRPDAIKIRVVLRSAASAQFVQDTLRQEIGRLIEANGARAVLIMVNIVEHVNVWANGKPQVVRKDLPDVGTN